MGLAAPELVLLGLGVLTDSVGLGLFLPAELPLLLLGDATSDDAAHPLPFLLVAAVATVLALVGAHVGLELGRRWSPPRRALEATDRLGPEWSAALSRFTPVVRPLAGALLGARGMTGAAFARWTVVPTLLWVAIVLLSGRVLADVIAVDPAVDRLVHLCLGLPLAAGLLAPVVERIVQRRR